MNVSPSIKKLSNVADRIELNLMKRAQAAGEVDSTMVTLSVRPVINNTLRTINLGKLLQNAIQKASDAAFAAGKEVSGSLSISEFICNATSSGGKWTVNPATSGLRVSGTLLQGAAGRDIKSVIAKANAAIIANVNKELNRMSANLPGTTLTNHSTDVDEISLEV